MVQETQTPILYEADYAGFWVRFISACIDFALYTPVLFGIRFAFDNLLGHATGVSTANANIDFAGAAARPSDVYMWWFEGTFGLVALVSYAWFFCSKMQGSPGMYLFKIRITDVNGNRISFLRAFAWCITGTIGWLICCAGILYLQKDIQVVQDMLTSCREQNIEMGDCVTEIEKVIGIPFTSFTGLMYSALGLTFFMFLIWALSIALPKDKTGFHNLICGTRFLKGRPA